MKAQNNHEPNLPESSQIISQPWNSALTFPESSLAWEQVLRILRKHSRFGLTIFLSLMALIVLYVVVQKDYYRPTARLEIAPPDSGINTLHEIETPVESANQDYLETQVQILSSDGVAVSVIRELHLDKNLEFVDKKKLKDSAPAGSATVTRSTVPGELAILLEQLDLATLTPAESAALEIFRRKLGVSSVRNTRLIEINFSSQDPQLAQLITNTLVTKFIDQNYKNRYATTMQASEWLSSQLEGLRKKVQQSGEAVADFQQKHGLVEVDDHDVPMSQLMNEVNRQLSDVQANRIENEAYVRMIDAGHGDAVPALRDDKLYQDLLTRYVDLRSQLAQVRAVYGDASVNVKKLEDQLTEVSLQIDAERKRTVARVRSTYAAAKDREQLMVNERDKLRADMAHMGSQLATYHMLKTEANANTDLYNTLQSRLREAGIYAGLRSSNIRVVDLAQNLHKPSGPHRALLLALGTFGSGMIAVIFSFLREGFRNTVRTPDDVRAWTGLPSLALLPAIAGARSLEKSGTTSQLWEMPSSYVDKNKVAIMNSSTTEAEAIRSLRTALLYGKKDSTPCVILISSSTEGEGKTTVAVNFAIALAQLAPTCLVEGDLRQPRVADAFKLNPSAGLVEVLEGSKSLADAVINIPEVDNLSVLPCGKPLASPADILPSMDLMSVLDNLKRKFSFIVMDSPPVIPFSDARVLSCLADEVLLVGRYGVTTRRSMQRTTELLGEVHASVAGVVLNNVDLSSPDYDYYTYGYSKWKSRRARELQVKAATSSNNNNDSKPGAMGAHA